MNRRRDLSCDPMIGKRANQTNGGVRRPGGDHCEIGMLGFIQFGKAVEPAAKLDNSTGVTQGIKRVGMYPKGDQIAGAQRPALVESLEGSVEVPGLRGG